MPNDVDGSTPLNSESDRSWIGESGAGFRSLTEAIDTTTPAGRMMMQMVGAFAGFERAMLKERLKVELNTALEEGRIGGRLPNLVNKC